MTKTSDLIVTEDSAKTAGLISYWRMSGAVKLDALASAWRANGFGEKLLPKPPTDEVALGRAVREQAGKRRLVRPLVRRGAWAIVDETVAQDKLEYTEVMRITHEESGPRMDGLSSLLANNGQQLLANSILNAFYRNQNELAPEDISAWLIKLANANAAVTLRDTGGIYFVPRPAVPFWRSVSAVLESVSAHKVFKIPAMTNSEAVEAITEAVAAEAEKAVATMTAELTGETQLGAKALKTRAAECTALLAKVAQYERLLDVQLPKVVATIAGLQASVAAASLMTPSTEAA